MDLSLKDKVAVITGGASGLGRETAHYMVRDGARVLIADINAENIEKVLDELRELGGEVDGVTVDVSSYGNCQKMAAFAKEKFGRVDVLVAGAGVGGEDLFLETKPEVWDRIIDINLMGVLYTNHAIAPMMVERGSGSIVNIASEAGKVGEKRISVYSASKGAVIAFSKAFAVEMGRFSVRVNAVCPGVTMTPMTAGYTPERIEKAIKFYPMGRLGQPEDIAAMITFLGSDQTSWVTGQAISVNGGFARS